jgi:hypothetical protein
MVIYTACPHLLAHMRVLMQVIGTFLISIGQAAEPLSIWLPYTLPAKHSAEIYISCISPPSPLPLSLIFSTIPLGPSHRRGPHIEEPH